MGWNTRDLTTEDEAAMTLGGGISNLRIPVGAYLYTVEIRYLNGTVEVLRNSVMLIL